MNEHEEYEMIAQSRDAYTLNQMVNLGLIPFKGAIAEKIQNSPELQLVTAIQDSDLSPIDQLKLVGLITVITEQ